MARSFFYLLSLCWLLVGCTTPAPLIKPSPSFDKAAYLNKTMRLSRPMYLVEVKPLNPLSYNGYWVFNYPVTTYYNNYIHATIPTIEDYQANPATWQAWQGAIMTDRARIAGILGSGAAFHVADIVPNGYGKGYWVTIQFDEGAFKGITAMYGNPKNLFPALYQ